MPLLNPLLCLSKTDLARADAYELIEAPTIGQCLAATINEYLCQQWVFGGVDSGIILGKAVSLAEIDALADALKLCGELYDAAYPMRDRMGYFVTDEQLQQFFALVNPLLDTMLDVTE